MRKVMDKFMIFQYTIWLFNIAMERSTMFKFGKPLFLWAIYIHLYHGELLVITRGYFMKHSRKYLGKEMMTQSHRLVGLEDVKFLAKNVCRLGTPWDSQKRSIWFIIIPLNGHKWRLNRLNPIFRSMDHHSIAIYMSTESC